MLTTPDSAGLSNSYQTFRCFSRSFVDPDQYRAAIRGGDSVLSILGRGTYHGEVTTILAGQVTLQRAHENLPRLSCSSIPSHRVGLLGWRGDGPLPIVRGTQMERDNWMCLGSGMQSHHRTTGPVDCVVLTLDASDLADAAFALTGRDLTVTPGKVLRPPAGLGKRLSSAIEAALRVSAKMPGAFASAQAAHALGVTLLRLMVMCLMHGEARREPGPQHRRATIARKFAAEIEANLGRPLLIPEVCRNIGVPERTLRSVCQEQLGMSPHQFLALRRLHLVRQTLLRSNGHSTTVTEAMTSQGIWEFGRFAGSYKALFGESPSATLARKQMA
jgi:AraC-like DNA-binding protein